MEKKKNKQYKSSKMGRLSSGGRINDTTTTPPLGPGPRTFSILAALNELSIFDKVSYLQRNNGVELSLPGRAEDQITTSEGATKQRKSRITVPHETEFFSGSAFTTSSSTPTPHHHPPPRRPQSSSSRSSDQVGRGLPGVEFNTPKPPDWIQKIFQLIKSGRLDELKSYLQGLDATVIRHLVNSKGGNLLHCAAGGGQLATLQWLVSILGRLADTALNDRDQNGRTPILKALKKKRLACFQWLVLETVAGEKALVPVERERSLLHHAACDGNLVAVQWLTQVLAERGVSLDLRDLSTGMTPLCEAASAGKVLVCHELISRGANPLQQTELGWRPMDYAIRRNQMECANYLTMAETAASLGTMLHSRLKEFQTLQEDHDSLRGHFRELLRVGKWLAKERTDLIKNFSSIGLKSAASTSSLLGGESLAGTRFSDMEHKLGQAEQASKHLLLRKNTTATISTTATESLIANGDAFNLQEILAAAQLRYDHQPGRGGDLPLSRDHQGGDSHRSRKSSASSSDDTTTTTTFRTTPIFPYFETGQVHKQVLWGADQKQKESSIAPWLLPNNSITTTRMQRRGNDDLLSPSPSPLNQLDLVVETPPQARMSSSSSSSTYSSSTPARISLLPSTRGNKGGYDAKKSSSGGGAGYDLTSSFCHNAEKDSLFVSSSQPTILEVIEPNLVSIKGPPDLIRESTRGDSIDCPRSSKNYSEIDDTIYSEIRSSASLKPHVSVLNSSANGDGGVSGECVPNSFSSSPQSPIISNSAPSNKCQNHQSCCDTDVLLSMRLATPPPHPSSCSHGQVMCLEESESSSVKKKGNNSAVSKVDDSFASTVIITEDKPKPGLRLNSNTATTPTMRLPNTTTTTLDDSSVVVVLRENPPPIDLSSSSPSRNNTFPSSSAQNFHYDEDISSCSSSSAPQDHQQQLVVLPESISTSNTPVLQRSFSSFSHSSSTVLFPYTSTTKGKWELGPLMNLESRSLLDDDTTHRHHISPSPTSEASHTESALAPPPSHASGSGGSHTESAREGPVEEEHVAGGGETENSNHTNNANEPLLETGQSSPSVPCRAAHLFGEDNQPQRRKISSGPTPRRPKDDEEEGHDEPPAAAEGRPPLVSSSSSSSSRIYKASIHYVTKNGRRQQQQQPHHQRKAWYEIEASDEEGDETSFLRQTRPSQSAMQQPRPNNSTTTTSPSHLSVSDHGSSNSNNNEQEQRHECDTAASCPPELNCADIV